MSSLQFAIFTAAARIPWLLVIIIFLQNYAGLDNKKSCLLYM